MTIARLAPLAALLMLGGCAYDYADGYAPSYPPGYDSGMGSGQFVQPGDLFGGQNVSSIEVFYGPLAPYGRWVDSRFGRAFQPNAPQDWRPYVNGRWGEDRLWISDDPWGWATDHYGRWGFDERVGWVWVPGTEWAPSWVAWREADDVTGWAPIPPGVSYSVGVGFGSSFGYDSWNSWYGPSWVWVPSPYLYRPGFGGGVLPYGNGYNYWRSSRWNYSSGWNGRPGYDHWAGRPGYGNRPPPPRPAGGYNGGRPGGYNDGRPGGYGQPGGYGNGRPDGGRPGGYNDGRPGNGQPGSYGNGRPGGPDGSGRPPQYQGGRPDQPRPGGGRPPGSYQGDPRPGGTPGYGRPPTPGEGRPPGAGYGRPPGAGYGRPREGQPAYAQPNPGGTGAPPMPDRPRGGFGGDPGGGFRPQPSMNAAPTAPPAMMAPPPRMERPSEAHFQPPPPPPRNEGQIERQARGADTKRERPQ